MIKTIIILIILYTNNSYYVSSNFDNIVVVVKTKTKIGSNVHIQQNRISKYHSLLIRHMLLLSSRTTKNHNTQLFPLERMVVFAQ